MVEEQYKTFWRRFFAGIIDAIVLYPLSLLQTVIFTHFTSMWILGTWTIFHSLAAILYTVLLVAWRGQTLGKMLLGVRVTDISGQPVTFKQSAMRELPIILISLFSISVSFHNFEWFRQAIVGGDKVEAPRHMVIVGVLYLLWFWSEFITMLFNNKRRAIHDLLAGTVVTKVGVHPI